MLQIASYTTDFAIEKASTDTGSDIWQLIDLPEPSMKGLLGPEWRMR